MKKYILIASYFLIQGCAKEDQKVNEKEYPMKSHSFFVGTYTDVNSQGIYQYQLNADGTFKSIGLSAKTENPSFLAYNSNRNYLVAVGETNSNGMGSIKSFKVDNDTLLPISQGASGGANPCFVAVNKNGYVVAANYTSGNLGLLKLSQNGGLKLMDVQQHIGGGSTDRQEGPHAHSAWFKPENDNEIISVDLGTNQLWFSKINASQKLELLNPSTLSMADSAGPRHLSFHPNGKWIYVLNELINTITLVTSHQTGYSIGQSFSTIPQDFAEFSKAADIHVSSDGKFVYASNRGHESIAMFEVDQKNGELTVIGFQNVMGKEPRNFSLSPDEKFLVVANEHTNNLVSFKRDINTGLLSYKSEISAPTPVCVLF